MAQRHQDLADQAATAAKLIQLLTHFLHVFALRQIRQGLGHLFQMTGSQRQSKLNRGGGLTLSPFGVPPQGRQRPQFHPTAIQRKPQTLGPRLNPHFQLMGPARSPFHQLLQEQNRGGHFKRNGLIHPKVLGLELLRQAISSGLEPIKQRIGQPAREPGFFREEQKQVPKELSQPCLFLVIVEGNIILPRGLQKTQGVVELFLAGEKLRGSPILGVVQNLIHRPPKDRQAESAIQFCQDGVGMAPIFGPWLQQRIDRLNQPIHLDTTMVGTELTDLNGHIPKQRQPVGALIKKGFGAHQPRRQTGTQDQPISLVVALMPQRIQPIELIQRNLKTGLHFLVGSRNLNLMDGTHEPTVDSAALAAFLPISQHHFGQRFGRASTKFLVVEVRVHLEQGKNIGIRQPHALIQRPPEWPKAHMQFVTPRRQIFQMLVESPHQIQEVASHRLHLDVVPP